MSLWFARSCFAIAKGNGDVEKEFVQIFPIVQRDRNRLNIEGIKGVRISKEVCLDVKFNDRLVSNAKAAHTRYTLDKA